MFPDLETLWEEHCRRMAPLFNGEGLRGPVEDLTETTRCLLQHGMSAEVMVGKLEGFLKMAMESIKIKLSTGPDDNKLANRLVELWSFYFGTVLPYLQGVFLPLESELKSNRSATCVRSTILLVYKNEMILPILGRIQEAFQKVIIDPEESRRSPDTVPRVMQMLNVLNELPSQHRSLIDIALNSIETEVRKQGRSLHMSPSENTINT